MTESKFEIPSNLGEDYNNHPVFKRIEEYSEFYDSLSFSVMFWVSQGTRAVMNIDTYTFSSIKGTLNSILYTLRTGRINDSYALLRKLYDATIINIYTDLYLKDNFNLDNIIVKQIEKWRTGVESIPEYRIISQYIKNSPKLKPITSLLYKDDKYKIIRDRCNDHTHYNFYYNLMLNNSEVYLNSRIKLLDNFLDDLDNIFVQHFALLFFINDHFMMSSDYRDSLDVGATPPKGSEYWVAPFIKEIFDKVINILRPDIAVELVKNTDMELN